MNKFNLEQKLNYIGIQLVGQNDFKSTEWIDIETVIYEASIEIINDARLFSYLSSWISVHGDYVIIEKLMKMQRKRESKWLIALAIFAANCGFHQWKRLIKKKKGYSALVDVTLARSSISLKGEDRNFRKFGFLIPKNTIRVRTKDVLDIERLIKKNRQYRNRLLYGASWRADIISVLEFGIETPYQIAKLLGCSYEPALRISKEFKLAQAI